MTSDFDVRFGSLADIGDLIGNVCSTPQTGHKLMGKQQILRFKPAPRFEQAGGEPSERIENRKHRSQS
jgi:hypothetical protein